MSREGKKAKFRKGQVVVVYSGETNEHFTRITNVDDNYIETSCLHAWHFVSNLRSLTARERGTRER